MGGKGKGKGEEKEWVPCTKLGRLVRDGKIRSMEQVFLFSLPIKEYQVTELFMKDTLKDEVMQIMPVQKQTSAGQRTRFKCVVAVGDYNGHIGMGTKCAKEVATAIRGGINAAKCGVVPVRRGYWGAKIGQPRAVPALWPPPPRRRCCRWPASQTVTRPRRATRRRAATLPRRPSTRLASRTASSRPTCGARPSS